MANDREREVRLKFLEEAQEYLDDIETGLLELGSGEVERQRMDAVLRAAHSIKGGAAMMGFDTLSHLAHRMEDFVKVIKADKEGVVDEEIERLLLVGVDRLRQIAAFNRQGINLDSEWLETNANPIFDQLHQYLGDPPPDTILPSEDEEEDMVVLLFQTEVEACLDRLQSVLDDPEQPCLVEEFSIAAQELGGLGEMLQLTAFSNLCDSIVEHLESATPEKTAEIASKALQELRRSQAMVLIGQTEAIPTQLDLTTPEILTPFLQDLELIPDVKINLVEELESNLLEELESDLPQPPEPIPPVEQPKIPREPVNKPDTVTPLPVPSASEQTIRVSLKQLDQLSDLFGELTIERNGLALQMKRLRNFVNLLSQRVRTLEQSNFRLRNAYDRIATPINGTSNPQQIEETSPVSQTEKPENLLTYFASASDFNNQFDLLEMDRYSDLHLLSREVMDTVVQLQEVASDIEISLEDTERSTRELTRTSKLMRKSITDVRMRPFSDLIGPFPRALREMSLGYSKKVQLRVRGESTLIDRSLLDSLKEPLLHLFRNAFDHGIEEPATRQATGKPEIGTIEISAVHRSNQTVITMSDDGAGIDIEKIRAKALNMGFNSEDLDAVGKNGLLELIFEPGFSTADKVTDISGRGVGMDVVRTNIRDIKGDIYVDTKPGLGTTFTIVVPFTLSVVRVLLVESDTMLMAFPTNAIEEMLVLEPEMVMTAAGKEVLNWEGEMLPLVRLSQWLKCPRPYSTDIKESLPGIDRPIILIVARGEELIALQFDRYWEEQEVTIRQVEGNIKMPGGFTSCTILGDGLVVPLVDPISLLRWIESSRPNNISSQFTATSVAESQAKTNIESPSTPAEKSYSTIMVVDDSINVRRFLTLTLEKAGYRVEQAKDGQDALEKLQAGLDVKAVICDIEMPVLDGYGFLANIKSDSGCRNIPVVMLTSRSSEKHRQLAINLGATAYFSKPFREPELLKTLTNLISN
ncbi:MAG: response regulator [Prochloraceae cyanobacterium]